MTEIHGRGGRIITVNEKQAASIAAAVNSVPHSREATSTQPMVQIPAENPSLLMRVDAWWDAAVEWIDRFGLIVFGTGAVGFLLLIFIAGMVRHV